MNDKPAMTLKEAVEKVTQWFHSPSRMEHGKEYKLMMKTIDALVEQNRQLREALVRGIEDIETWGSYVSPYFQNKHNLAQDIDDAEQTLAATDMEKVKLT